MDDDDDNLGTPDDGSEHGENRKMRNQDSDNTDNEIHWRSFCSFFCILTMKYSRMSVIQSPSCEMSTREGGKENVWSYKERDSQELKQNVLGSHGVRA